jgi:hypothetical protein
MADGKSQSGFLRSAEMVSVAGLTPAATSKAARTVAPDCGETVGKADSALMLPKSNKFLGFFAMNKYFTILPQNLM